MLAACGPSIGDGSTGAATGSGGGQPGTTTVTTATTSDVTTAPGDVTTAPASSSIDDGSDSRGGTTMDCCDVNPGVLECDPIAQDCPKGQKCTPWANDGSNVHNAARCSPIVDNPGQDGDPCTVETSLSSGIDDCDIGLMCFEVDPATNVGVCRGLCESGGQGCADPETACTAWNDGFLSVCSLQCDPLLPECGPGMGCYGVPDIVCDEMACGYDLGGGGQGDACTLANECSPGLQCSEGALVPDCEGPRCCTEVCDASDPVACPALPGTTCLTLGEGICPPAFYFFGICVIA